MAEVDIDTPPASVLCQIHGEPFRTRWPKGYGVFAMHGLRTVLEHGLQFECEHDAGRIEAALRRKPICCRLLELGEKYLIEAYVECGVGEIGLCGNCLTAALGTPYSWFDFGGRARRHKHACFECIARFHS